MWKKKKTFTRLGFFISRCKRTEDYIDDTNDYSEALCAGCMCLRDGEGDWHCLVEKGQWSKRVRENKTIFLDWVGMSSIFLLPSCIADSCGFVSTYTEHSEPRYQIRLQIFQTPLKNRLKGVVDTNKPRNHFTRTCKSTPASPPKRPQYL
jgi:hypothetical protein